MSELILHCATLCPFPFNKDLGTPRLERITLIDFGIINSCNIYETKEQIKLRK